MGFQPKERDWLFRSLEKDGSGGQVTACGKGKSVSLTLFCMTFFFSVK